MYKTFTLLVYRYYQYAAFHLKVLRIVKNKKTKKTKKKRNKQKKALTVYIYICKKDIVSINFVNIPF